MVHPVAVGGQIAKRKGCGRTETAQVQERHSVDIAAASIGYCESFLRSFNQITARHGGVMRYNMNNDTINLYV
jgi:hypothetical protein